VWQGRSGKAEGVVPPEALSRALQPLLHMAVTDVLERLYPAAAPAAATAASQGPHSSTSPS
jgi:hypothetical protein